MANNYEPIEYDVGEVKELFDSCIKTGKIIDVDHDNNKADVEIVVEEEIETFSAVPIHYHCEESETVDDGHMAFEEDDEVYILHDGSRSLLDSSTLKIIGFVAGLKECLRKVYLRPKIDGNFLRSGGQGFKIRYHKRGSPDVWSVAVTEEQVPQSRVYVRGKWDGTEQDKYGYVEKPLYLYEWDGGEIQILLYVFRDKSKVNFPGDPPYYDSEGRPFIDINSAMTNSEALYAFSAVEADPTGDYMGIRMKNYFGFPGSPTYPTTVNGTIVDLTRHVEISSALIDPDDPCLNSWEYTGGCWLTENIRCSQCYLYAKSSLGTQKFRMCWEISKTFTAEETAALMENHESSIYNWGTEEYETNQIVLIPNLLFNLVETLLDQPPQSLAPDDWHFCGPYVKCEDTEKETRTMNPRIFAPIIFDWVQGGGNTPVGGSEVAGACIANCIGGGLFRGAKVPNKGIERLNGIGFTEDWESLSTLYEGKVLQNRVSITGPIMALTPHDSMELTLTRTAGCTVCLYKMEPLPEAHSQYRY